MRVSWTSSAVMATQSRVWTIWNRAPNGMLSSGGPMALPMQRSKTSRASGPETSSSVLLESASIFARPLSE